LPSVSPRRKNFEKGRLKKGLEKKSWEGVYKKGGPILNTVKQPATSNGTTVSRKFAGDDSILGGEKGMRGRGGGLGGRNYQTTRKTGRGKEKPGGRGFRGGGPQKCQKRISKRGGKKEGQQLGSPPGDKTKGENH